MHSAYFSLVTILMGDIVIQQRPSSLQDLLFSKKGSSLAVVLATGAELDSALARAQRASHTYTRLLVFTPSSTLDSPDTLDLMQRGIATLLNTSLVTMPMGASFTEQALAHALALFEASQAGEAWHERQSSKVSSAEAVARALAAIPALGVGANEESNDDAMHRGRMLHMLGPIVHLSTLSARELMAGVGLSTGQAAELANFFADAA